MMELTYIDYTLFILLVFLLYYYGKRRFNFYENTDVKHIKPMMFSFGSTTELLLERKHMVDLLQKYYHMFPDEKYVGLFNRTKPLILLKDLELIKTIGIKSFDSFPNHTTIFDAEIDSLMGNALINLKDNKWRDMRSTLSPAFTSSKMKNMFIFIEGVAKQVANHFLNQYKDAPIEIEVKDIFTRYTNDVIANSVFGLEVNSLVDENNEFYTISKKCSSSQGAEFIKFLFVFLFPKVMKVLGIEFINKKSKTFFRQLVNNTMKYRLDNSIIRKDMIHLLNEAKKGSLKHENVVSETSDAGFATVSESSIGKHDVKINWTDDELVAQALLFIIGGFDTTSTLITFFFYEIVKNYDIQRRLQCEIDEFIINNGDSPNYMDIHKLRYLDNCISETLRLWPPGIVVDRSCSERFELPPPNSNSTKKYIVQPGTSVWIPVYSIHRDPKHFPNPETFDPDRFSDENKASINANAYLPFGIGPRNCIGSRYALMVVKIIIFNILAKFDVIVTDKTQIPLEIDYNSFNLLMKGGVHVALKVRQRK